MIKQKFKPWSEWWLSFALRFFKRRVTWVCTVWLEFVPSSRDLPLTYFSELSYYGDVSLPSSVNHQVSSCLVSAGDRMFHTYATGSWNVLPIRLRETESLSSFISQPETNLFQQYYNVEIFLLFKYECLVSPVRPTICYEFSLLPCVLISAVPILLSCFVLYTLGKNWFFIVLGLSNFITRYKKTILLLLLLSILLLSYIISHFY